MITQPGTDAAVVIVEPVRTLTWSDAATALVTMCCGGGLGTGTILERI